MLRIVTVPYSPHINKLLPLVGSKDYYAFNGGIFADVFMELQVGDIKKI